MNLFTRSVARITASLRTMVERLEAHATEQREKAGRQQAEANRRLSLMDAHLTEAAQAERVREKLTSIID